ncbi:hypothetical protein VTJ04DRAFT_3478 [Mycothermus thermophilus]|uniref:uncharacterized protein n=1 Tax=Humicola insolens TaxID=85995 RepID=UPI003742DE2A
MALHQGFDVDFQDSNMAQRTDQAVGVPAAASKPSASQDEQLDVKVAFLLARLSQLSIHADIASIARANRDAIRLQRSSVDYLDLAPDSISKLAINFRHLNLSATDRDARPTTPANGHLSLNITNNSDSINGPSIMTDRLPPNLLALFAPRPPLRYLPPIDHPPEQRRTVPIDGLAQFLPAMAEYEREYEYHPTESWLEARDRKQREKAEKIKKLLEEGPKNFNPHNDPNIRGDPFKTLIVARLSYEADEKDLEREFGRYGPIERIRLIRDTHAHEKPNKKIKPHRGYAFIVFEREKDMRAALEACDGILIKGRRIKVDVERGRTVKGWKPMRLGGGLGGRGYTKAAPPRHMGPGGFGGFRGGFGGGFRARDRGFRGGGGGGGFGDRGGGYRGGPPGGDRGFGGRDRGSGGPPGAPTGPGGGFGSRDGRDGRDNRDTRDGRDGRREDRGGYGRDRYEDRSYRDRDRDRDRTPRQTGSNMEPIRPREGRENGGYGGGRDYDRPRDHEESRKRGYEGSYEDPRKLRRY